MKIIVDWLTEEEATDKEDNGLGGMGGWFGKNNEGWNAGHRWPDYIDQYNDEDKLLVEEIRKGILANKIRCTGEQKQDGGGKVVPLWDDGTVTFYTWRGWGDLMAAIYSTEDNKNYSYMDFYM